MRGLGLLWLAAGAVALVLSGQASASPDRRIEVVVALEPPALAEATRSSRALTARARSSRLELRTATSHAYLKELASVQDDIAGRIRERIPSAVVRWHYQVVLDGLAVVLPQSQLTSLAHVPGIRSVYPNVLYHAALDRSPELIGADQLWGQPSFSTAGNGIKIGIIDDGLDSSHPFFRSAGYSYPPGFPKGRTAFTTPKVIVARAFAPPSTSWKYARRPFDPVNSEHATHVAGIAAGNWTRGPIEGRGPLSGVAPRAYLGNYKALTVPTSAFGLDGNAPELAAAVEAAVRDGMDVINLSLGEPEIEPSRDVLVAAIDGAADAGVVPVIAAGNDFTQFGRGSVASPGSAAKAITAAAVSESKVVADFSSSGPTPISLALKPDVSAPGESIFSSVPRRVGTWAELSGTSMAAPHVAGGAALLRQRHPDWTVAQIKSALVLTGLPVFTGARPRAEVPVLREGGGLINLPRANTPLILASPTELSLGLVRQGMQLATDIEIADAGGGAGEWTIDVRLQPGPSGVRVLAPTSLSVPGTLTVQVDVAAGAAEGDAMGFIVLRRGADARRIPFWLHVETPRLGTPARLLSGPGVYSGDTRRGHSRVSTYRYPELTSGAGLHTRLPGPEQVFRVRIASTVANFGVRVVSTAAGVTVTPRVVVAGDENRLAGYAALPLDINPYRILYGSPLPVVAAIAPAAGLYDIVFDTPSRQAAGRFLFRLWVNDTSPPRARLVPDPAFVEVALTDAGSGVDPRSLRATVDGRSERVSFRPKTGRAIVLVSGLRRGRHRLVLTASDYQEAKNMENVGPILPNTLVFRTTFRVK